MTDTRTIKDRLLQDHGIAIQQCPRFDNKKAMMKEGRAVGCCGASDAANFLRGGQMLPCHCTLRDGEAA